MNLSTLESFYDGYCAAAAKDEGHRIIGDGGGAANDRTLEGLITPFLREWLYRKGARGIEKLTDEQLLTRIRYTFIDAAAPLRPSV